MITSLIPHLVAVIGFKYKLHPKPIFQSHYFLFQYWFCPQGQHFKLALSSDRSFSVIAVIPGVSCSQITFFSYSSKLSKSFSVINRVCRAMGNRKHVRILYSEGPSAKQERSDVIALQLGGC